MKSNVWFKVLRVAALVMLSLTAAFTLLGGIGTTCVAFNAEKFGERMAPLIPVKPIFQVLVVISIAAALFGVFSAVWLGRGKAKGYRYSLIFLLVGGTASAVQYYFSATLRGSTAPNNVRLYLTLLTLAVLLLLGLPGTREKVFGARGAGKGQTPAGGAALFTCGLLTISTPLWGAPTHIIAGENTVNVLLIPLLVVGAGMLLAGGVRLLGWKPRLPWAQVKQLLLRVH